MTQEQETSQTKKSSGMVMPVVFFACALAVAGYAAKEILPGMDLRPASVTINDPRVDAIEIRLEEMAKAFNQLPQKTESQEDQQVAGSVSVAPEIEERLRRLEDADAKTSTEVRRVLARAFAYMDLRSAVDVGAPFSRQMEKLRSVFSGNSAVDGAVSVLATAAGSGVPTFAALGGELVDVARHLKKKSVKTEASSWLDMFKAAVESLISVRSAKDDRLDGVFRALAANDSAAALSAVDALPVELRDGLSQWREKLVLKSNAERALQSIADEIGNASAQGEGGN